LREEHRGDYWGSVVTSYADVEAGVRSKTARRDYLPLARRLLPRLFADLFSVAIGLLVFAAVVHHFELHSAEFSLVYVAIAIVIDFTHVRREWSRLEEVILAFKVGAEALVLTTALAFLLATTVSRIMFITIALMMVIVRPLITITFHRLERVESSQRTLVVTCNDAEYAELIDAIAVRDVYPLRVVARVSESADATNILQPVRSTSDSDLLDVCRTLRPWKVMIGSSGFDHNTLTTALLSVNEMGIQVRTFADLFEEEFGRVPLVSLDASWFLFDIGPLHKLGYRALRRSVDIGAGLLIGLALIVVYPFVAAAIRLDSPGPIFYRQKRRGKGGEIFEIVKFRTMRMDAETSGPQFAQRGDDRVTRVGRFLRRTRIDELPQCVNLLRGEMSLIGPRPERPEFVDDFSVALQFYEKRYLIKPGLTGWAQVHEGYGAGLDDTRRKLERDLYYLKHQSPGLDLRIMAATVSSIVRFEGR
jgi:exopolysaccharide biosynthesis polyprenyl glycosylphosphotransferase